ncbi:beta-lactamase class C [Dendryphion nanum]|uniref:Beta-lactamase class C n=1 Tax=Dendryphion nanum TaxID=256645 RepID=A0A9P9D5K7_9PLEO|nr:beta-lactamase class C [Dendryphion nanum]
MENFEAILKDKTSRGTKDVPGANLAVVDKDGNYLYKKTTGYNGTKSDAKPLDFDQTFFMASCTKLITSIAALQNVEKGLITLDEPLDRYLPELAAQPIIEPSSDTGLNFRPAVSHITLRQLVTHSSGAAYDFVHPLLGKWRQDRGEAPGYPTRGIIEEDYALPRTFESGEGWIYGPGLDWAGLLIARLNKISLEEYIEENIAKPLGIQSWTFHISEKQETLGKLMELSVRNADGVLESGPVPPFPDPINGNGGGGLYSNAHDYTRVLADLLKENPILLKKESVDELFAPQLGEGSRSLNALHAIAGPVFGCTFGTSVDGLNINHGLGGLLVAEDIDRDGYYKPKGSLTWSGMPNLLWSINREKGIALFFATQVFPWGDPKSWDLACKFETAVWKTFA